MINMHYLVETLNVFFCSIMWKCDKLGGIWKGLVQNVMMTQTYSIQTLQSKTMNIQHTHMNKMTRGQLETDLLVL